jgi:hypothetical protein
MQGGSQARVLSEKAGRIRPNELYPAPEMLASAAQWTRAVQGMGEKVKDHRTSSTTGYESI